MLLTFASAEDAERARAAIADDLPRGTVRLAPCVRGFDGALQSDLMIFAAALAPVVVKKLADVIVEIVRARAAREVSVDGVSLKGFSVEEARALIERRAAPTEAAR